jgi:pimeloyl-ACP methyl ester carboxylesterase
MPRQPTRVRALVLVHPAPPLTPQLMEAFGKEMASRRLPEDAQEIHRIEESPDYAARDLKTLEHYYRLYYAPFFREHENALAADYGFTQLTAENVIGTGGRLFSDFGEHDLPGKLGAISSPTLVVHGELDPVPSNRPASSLTRSPPRALSWFRTRITSASSRIPSSSRPRSSRSSPSTLRTEREQRAQVAMPDPEYKSLESRTRRSSFRARLLTSSRSAT